MSDEKRYMPIMAVSYRASEDITALRGQGSRRLVLALPWAMIAPHDARARSNHGGQSLDRLAERGGLGVGEAVAILEDRVFSHMTPHAANERLLTLLDEYERSVAFAAEPPADDLLEELLMCLAEECCEVGQRVSKAKRFGLGQRQRGQPLDNAQRIVEELHDLISVALLLERRGALGGVIPDEATIQRKLEKIVRYMSVKKTGLDPEPPERRERPEPTDAELGWAHNPVTGQYDGVDTRTGRIVRHRAELPLGATKRLGRPE